MKAIFNRLFICMNIFLCSCTFYTEPEYVRLSDRIVVAYAKKLQNDYGVYLVGSGGSMMHNIKKISLYFDCYRTVSIDEARTLYMAIVQGYLNQYNENPNVKPYLDQVPFGWDNMNIMLSFLDSKNILSTEGVALVFKGKNGSIVYEGHDGKSFYSLHRDQIEDILPCLAN